eukprot:TRINITY_DN32162_c0_g1_i1.p1 TRINITY_DN32162_c0_g1~~TRINITY_DN32162_c0_g1_i1.p1  ORF type:complete len:198 (+),score=68.33 TRINITY_DN32162_c0_g1_i1:85-678(+)
MPFFLEPLREWFMNLDVVASIHATFKNTRVFVHSVLSLGMVLFSALMIWRFLTAVTCSDSPIVVVLSGSMETGMFRGDLLLLTLLDTEPYTAGMIPVFKVDGRDIPIVHRIIQSHRDDDTDYGEDFELLTKGDSNSVADHQLYAPGQKWVERRHMIGVAKAFLPHLGRVTILMNDYPYLKFGMLGGLALLAIANRDE